MTAAGSVPSNRAIDGIERFDPLGRILTYDSFDSGLSGWTSLSGNHDGRLESIRPLYRDLRPPQLSSVDFFDIGTHGPMSGNYAMKLATRPQVDSSSVGIRRLTMRELGRAQVEMYFAYKAEVRQADSDEGWDGNHDPGEYDFGSFTISNDICRPGGDRCHMALKFENTSREGDLVERWRYKTGLQATTKRLLADPAAADATDMHTVDPDSWKDIPGGVQPLCYNEVATKVNWHYLRWQFDTAEGRSVELQVNDRTYDLSDIPVPMFPEKYGALDGLMNILIDVQTTRPVRNFMFVDTVVVSVDW
ncbi:hypothetical protein BH10ACT7_BH10ACT7_00030 [soil metagenome]